MSTLARAMKTARVHPFVLRVEKAFAPVSTDSWGDWLPWEVVRILLGVIAIGFVLFAVRIMMGGF